MSHNKARIEAVVLTMLLLGAMFLVPATSVEDQINEKSDAQTYRSVYHDSSDAEVDPGPYILDRRYIVDPEPAPLNMDDNDDAGTKKDAGDKISRADPIFPGEVIDDTPGRGRTGKLSSSDDEDWYFFSVCDGQDMTITMTPPSAFNFDMGLWDDTETEKATSTNSGSTSESIIFTAGYSGLYYLRIHYISGSGNGQYSFDVTMDTQNDANSGDDAGGTFAAATLLPAEGEYSGYLDMDDAYDWYKFDVDSGKGIHFDLKVTAVNYLSDFDISLYKPNGELVYEERYYYNDELLYPADVSGEWRVKIDIFPGWTEMPEPTEWEYYTYGSGAYTLEYSIEDSAPPPPAPIPQPDITPIAKTFIINNDPDSNKDEYGYLASIPACNYLEGGGRYLAPIVYEGDSTSTNYFETGDYRGNVDDTTDYLLEDWNAYLGSHVKTATNYIVPADPIEAAADIAINNWGSSDLAVVAVDGSDFEDEVKQVLKKTKTLKREAPTETIYSDDPKIGEFGRVMFLGSKWCAINVSAFGVTASHTDSSAASLTQVFPQFMSQAGDWWPVPYDGTGNAIDIYYPVTQMGIWSAGSSLSFDHYDYLEITKYAGHRYKIRIGAGESDSALKVTVKTDTPSDLLVFLVDPKGHIRAPDIPQWNGPVLPIHEWYGFENPPQNPWRCWNPGPHTEFSAEVLHPEKGKWTVIVVPRDAQGSNKIEYTVTGELRKINPDRADAAVSAANAAVIASLEHAPLLYVKKDSVPTQTSDAFTSLGVTKVIFVERNDIGKDVVGSLPTKEADLTDMGQIVDYIKDYDDSENFITITSIKSGDGYFAPAAMLAAYHGSPVFRIGDAPGNPAGVADRIETWRLWDGDYYHGSRAPGHLPVADEPIDIGWIQLFIKMIQYFIGGGAELPPLGLDAKRYWNEELHDAIHDWIAGYGLDKDGEDEGYCFVAPRKDIYLPAHSVMMGNNSYAGHIPGITPAYTSAVVVRNILYPALIFANENRDVTTTMLMNFPDGGGWTTNDGVFHNVYSSRELKKSFSSHFRTYEGHALWDAHLERMNEGTSVFYYSGHGTGGSGQSAQYLQTEHSNYPEQVWWDAWRGYMYDNWKMPRHNGRRWYNPEPPNLYDIIHYDHVDGNYENLGSTAVFYMSCSTQDAFGPMVFLDHGSVLNYGNAGSGLCPEADFLDDEFFKSALIYGEPVGPAYAKEVWLHMRDFTTKDPTSMYGSSSLYPITTVHCIYGDPTLILYSPEWTSPIPIDA
ncbi:MAG: hypothetical protein JSW60_08455 [Thermoplasmatales archaeon]|nr:MAG: hypothetical protein JSW60_08455 [Thermoplasmatales archaeon]